MGDKSGIEWTDATWNPVVGCDRVSPGCDNCYAIAMSRRIQAAGNEAYQGLVEDDDWTGVVRCLPERLDQPERWRRPRRIFVNSMSDLFHPDVPVDLIVRVFNIMAGTSRHRYQVLTKRPQRMAQILSRVRRCRLGWLTHNGEDPTSYGGTGHVVAEYDGWPLPNVWLGTSIEKNPYTFRADRLRETPAAVRFLSLEPLLGPLPSLDLTGIDWVIVGGESGPGARPMHPDWVREIRDRCVEAGVAFFFKQWGEWAPHHDGIPYVRESKHRMNLRTVTLHPDGTEYDRRRPDTWPGSTMLWRIGKRAAGRELDGRTWDEYPEASV